MTEQNILLVDDDPELGELVSLVAQQMGVRCKVTDNAQSFLASLSSRTTLVILDLLMPGLDGIELLRLLSQGEHKPPIVLISGTGKRVLESAQHLAESLGLTIAGHLQKPLRLETLENMLGGGHVPHRVLQPAARPELLLNVQEFRKALLRDEFVLHYQPQLELVSGEVIGLEALVRWMHPLHGIISPAAFIPFAEENGFVDQLGWFVIERGLQEFRGFRANLPARASISLNVSVLSLKDLSFPDRLLVHAAQSNLPPDRVVLEITETGLIGDLSSALDVVTRLRMRGVQLSIDDFGSGYSMMTQLRHVPANEIKIDHSFIARLSKNESDRVMVQKMIELGHELHLRVVAEGVENEQQLEHLRRGGCELVQGSLISPALPPSDLRLWLDHRRNQLLTPR